MTRSHAECPAAARALRAGWAAVYGVVLFVVCGSLLAPAARASDPMPSTVALGDLVTADGRLAVPAGFSGRIDPAGWTLGMGADGPVFRRAAADGDERWNASRHFNTLGANGDVYAVVVDDDGNVYVGGAFTKAGNLSASYIAKFAVGSGVNTTKWLDIGVDFDGDVWDLALGPDGNLYAAGAFTQAGGVEAEGVAKYDGTTWTALGEGVNGTAYALAFSGVQLYVGGDFTQAGGNAARNMATYNVFNGTWAALGDGTTGDVYALQVVGGNVYAGGDFNSAGGTTVNNVARWSIPNERWFALSNTTTGVSGVSGEVWALAADGVEVYVGGDFTVSIDGVNDATNIAVWDGALWDRLYDGSAEGTSGTVYSLAVRNDYVYVGGSFATAGSETVSNVAAWRPSTLTWELLDPGQPAAASGAGSTVRDLFFSQRGATEELYAAGEFAAVGSGFNVNRVAVWDLDAANDEWRGLGYGVDGPIYALLYQADDERLYVGGNFSAVGGYEANNIAYIDLASSSGDRYGWGRLTNAAGTLNGTDGPVYALAAADDGNDILVGGDFDHAAGAAALDVTVNNLALWRSDSPGWSAIRGSLSGTTPGTNGPIYALAVENPASIVSAVNLLLIGGDFTTAGGSSSYPYFAAIDHLTDAGALTGGYDEVGGSFNGVVRGIAVYDNDNAIIGGDFTSAGGRTVADLVQITDVGGANSFDELGGNPGDGTNGPVYAVHISDPSSAIGAGNPLFIGGSFTQITTGGASVDADYLAIWDGTTMRSAAPTGGTGLNGPVYALQADIAEEVLYAGGTFTTADATAASGVATATLAGAEVTAWSAQGSGVNSTARTVALAPASNRVYYGGDFTTAGASVPSFYLAEWNPPTGVSGGGTEPPVTVPTLAYLADDVDLLLFDRTTGYSADNPFRVTLTWNAVDRADGYKLWVDLGAPDGAVDITGATPTALTADTAYVVEIADPGANPGIEFVVCGTLDEEDTAANGGPYDATGANLNDVTTGTKDGNDGLCLTGGADDDASDATVDGVDLNLVDAGTVPTYNGTTYAAADFAAPGELSSVLATVVVPASVTPRLYRSDGTSVSISAGDAVVAVYTDPASDGAWRGAGLGHWEREGGSLLLNIYGDNPSTASKDGYDSGEVLRFLIFETDDAGGGASDFSRFYLARARFNGVTSTFASNAIYQATRFDGYELTFTPAEHQIALEAGWNLFSSFLDPGGSTNDDDVDDIFRGSAGDVDLGFTSGATDTFGLVRTLRGALYYPSFGINTINSYSVDQGYQVYMTAADTLRIVGSLPSDFAVSVPAGLWSILPYQQNRIRPIADVLADNLNDIVAVRDNAGNAFVPGFGIDQIEFMRPGQAYLVYANAATTVTYDPYSQFVADSIVTRRDAVAATLGRTVGARTARAQIYQPIATNTGSSASLILDGTDLTVGDEVGVFNEQAQVVGAAIVETDGRVVVTAWGDDIVTEDVDGALPGETLTLRLWKAVKQQELPLNVTDVTDALTGAKQSEAVLTYQENALLSAQTALEQATGVAAEPAADLPAAFALGGNYPNPFNPTTTIRYALPEPAPVTLTVYDVMGREMARLVDAVQPAGRYAVAWDARSAAGQQLASGLYLYTLRAGGFVHTRQMVLLK